MRVEQKQELVTAGVNALLIGIFVTLLLGETGCISAYTVMHHNATIREKAAAVQVIPQPGGAAVGVNLLDLMGYWGAWKDAPGSMALSTLGDAACAGGLYAIADKQGWLAGGHHDTSVETVATPPRGNGNILINNSSDVHVSYGNQSSGGGD